MRAGPDTGSMFFTLLHLAANKWMALPAIVAHALGQSWL